jgi:hypothetical protein
MSQNHERRQFQRISFDAPVEVSQDQLHALSEVIDISLKGILIKDQNMPFDLEQPVHIRIKLGDSAEIVMTAEWTLSQQHAQAFRWTQVDIESMMHLRRLLELNTGDEALIERELAKLSPLE